MSNDNIVPSDAGTPLFIILICGFVIGTFVVAFSLETIVFELSRAVGTVKHVIFDSWRRGQESANQKVKIEPDPRKETSLADSRSGSKWSLSGLRRRRVGTPGQSDRTEDEAEKAVGLENGHAS